MQAICTQQKAKIKINSDLTKDIQIEKGTRQGCPLSPLLFILTLEMVNNLVRNNRQIRGTKKKGEDYKI